MTIKIHKSKPVNGIDVSHWNGAPPTDALAEHADTWLKFMGIKATHHGNRHCPGGVDPKFAANRRAAQDAQIPYVGLYAFLEDDVDQREQVLLLAETVGTLEPNEFVFLDWERPGMLAINDDAVWHMNHIFGRQRWAVYVNDSTPQMLAWLQQNAALLPGAPSHVPVFHPDWSHDGYRKAAQYQATLWQVGIGPVEGYPEDIDLDFIVDEDMLRRLVLP